MVAVWPTTRCERRQGASGWRTGGRSSRWATGAYWRRLFVARPDRLLRVVAAFRHREHVRSGGSGFGFKGWMPTAKAALSKAGLMDYWDEPRKAAREDISG